MQIICACRGILAAWLLARGEAGLGSLVPVPAPSMGLRLGMNRERLTTSTSALSVTCLSPPPRAACPSFGYKHQPALSTNPLFNCESSSSASYQINLSVRLCHFEILLLKGC